MRQEEYIVSDMSLFMQMGDLGMLEKFFSLPWAICTTDIVLGNLRDPVLKRELRGFLSCGRLRVEDYLPCQVSECQMSDEQQQLLLRLSVADCSVYELAQSLQCPLLAGDRKLRQMAESNVEVYDLRFVLDQCVRCGVMDEEEALSVLERLRKWNLTHLSDEDIKLMKSMDTMK